jgi:DNA modification methylase
MTQELEHLEEDKNLAENLEENIDTIDKWKNKAICLDCVAAMKQLPSNCVDLFVLSPPYDSLRDYDGNPTFNLHDTGEQIFRLLKEGGICAMVIQDQTKDFGKTLTSFRTILDWCDSFGFKLFECVIYRKNGTEGAWWKKRFRVDHEYIPIFLKGQRPSYFNKENLKIPSKHGGKTMTGFANRKTNGETQASVTKVINPMKCRGTIWDYLCAGDKNKTKRQHPAPFPDKIPYDLIECFCPVDGLVIDPFLGSGSTAIAAVQLNRNFIGFDISNTYIENIANKRIEEAQNTLCQL